MVSSGERGGTATRSPVAAYLDDLLERHASVSSGEVATYIPELATADPSLFGICLTTIDGAVYESGDTRERFTIESMSKPLTYGLTLEHLGEAVVRSRVGVEPSGDAFNEISLAPVTATGPDPRAGGRRGEPDLPRHTRIAERAASGRGSTSPPAFDAYVRDDIR